MVMPPTRPRSYRLQPWPILGYLLQHTGNLFFSFTSTSDCGKSGVSGCFMNVHTIYFRVTDRLHICTVQLASVVTYIYLFLEMSITMCKNSQSIENCAEFTYEPSDGVLCTLKYTSCKESLKSEGFFHFNPHNP